MNAENEVAREVATLLNSLMLSILGCFLLYGVWVINQQQINREMASALVRYGRVVSSMVPAPTIVIGPAPQPWYLTLFYLCMSVAVLWSLSGIWKGLSRTKKGLSLLEV